MYARLCFLDTDEGKYQKCVSCYLRFMSGTVVKSGPIATVIVIWFRNYASECEQIAPKIAYWHNSRPILRCRPVLSSLSPL